MSLDPTDPKRMTAENTAHYRPSIDGLRAVAILLVVGFHVFPTGIRGGFLGVDVFFVISGYLISTILIRNLGGGRGFLPVLADFYGRRIRRILPALALVLFACYGFGYFYVLSDQFKDDCLNIAASAGFCENLAAAKQNGYFEASALAKPLLHIWSLGVEEQFYLVWPLLIGLFAFLRIRLLPAMVFLAGCSYCLNFYPLGTPAGQAFYLPHVRLWELTMGAIAALAAPALQAQLASRSASIFSPAQLRTFCNALSWLGAILIGLGLWFVHGERSHLNAWMLLPVSGAFLLICAGENAWLNRMILARKLPIAIGLISYPLYLWHWPLLTFARMTIENGDSLPVRLAAIGIAVILSWATYRFLETPVRHGNFRRTKTAAALAAIIVAGVLGYAGYRQEGYPGRNPLTQALFDYAKNPYRGTRPATLLTPDEGPSDFPPLAPEIDPAKPTIFLWGDSFADHLYHGLRTRFSGDYNVVERTMMQTPPFVGREFENRPKAREVNDSILEMIRQVRPACVVLAGSWRHYDWKAIERTVTALRAAGVTRIIVVGPAPEWEVSLPNQVLNFYRKHPGEPVPKRMWLGAKLELGQVDASMKAFSEHLGVEYFSPYQALLDKDGFLVRVGDDITTLVTLDSGHLSHVASDYVIGFFPEIKK